MSTTIYPAFEAALAAGDKAALLNLYDLEHQLRFRAEAEKAALLWQLHHGTTGKAAEPGYLAGLGPSGNCTAQQQAPIRAAQTTPKPTKPTNIKITIPATKVSSKDIDL